MKINIAVIAALFVAVFGFLTITGTLTSGYHFTDDHSIITLTNDLKTESVLSVAVRSIRADFNIRFRPLYQVHRIIQARVLGNDFFLWQVWTAILACATFTFFYLGMRVLRFSVIEALLFILFTFAGPQMVAWWRLGINETIGMFFLGAAFYFMVSCEKRYTRNTVLFCLSLSCASWCKESFVITVPAFLVFKLWHENDHFALSLRKVFWKNRLLVIPFVVMCFDLWIIFFVVGTNKIGYGPDVSAIAQYVYKIVVESLPAFAAIVVMPLGFLYFGYRDRKRFAEFLTALIQPLVFALLVLIPNVILYAKPEMVERYLLPATMGVAFFLVSLWRMIAVDFRWFSRVWAVIVIFLVLANPVHNMFDGAMRYAKEGFQTNKLLSAIIQNSNEKSNILLVAIPADRYEWSYSLNKYLSLVKNVQLYVFPINPTDDVYKTDGAKGLSKTWHAWFKDRKFEDIKGETDMVIFFDKILLEPFLKESGIDSAKYFNLLNQNDSCAVYKKEQ